MSSTNKEEQLNNDFIIHKVVIPSLIGWPSQEVILYLANTERAAQHYIDTYPNIFLRNYLKVVPELLFKS